MPQPRTTGFGALPACITCQNGCDKISRLQNPHSCFRASRNSAAVDALLARVTSNTSTSSEFNSSRTAMTVAGCTLILDAIAEMGAAASGASTIDSPIAAEGGESV